MSKKITPAQQRFVQAILPEVQLKLRNERISSPGESDVAKAVSMVFYDTGTANVTGIKFAELMGENLREAIERVITPNKIIQSYNALNHWERTSVNFWILQALSES